MRASKIKYVQNEPTFEVVKLLYTKGNLIDLKMKFYVVISLSRPRPSDSNKNTKARVAMIITQ